MRAREFYKKKNLQEGKFNPHIQDQTFFYIAIIKLEKYQTLEQMLPFLVMVVME
jgi:hypothetical protein